jgi:hypothetical protein
VLLNAPGHKPAKPSRWNGIDLNAFSFKSFATAITLFAGACWQIPLLNLVARDRHSFKVDFRLGSKFTQAPLYRRVDINP